MKNAKILIDMEKMPGYEHRDGFIGLKSVSEGKVFLQKFSAGYYPSCQIHGAMLCVAVHSNPKGKIWRCFELGCGEGCYEPTKDKESIILLQKIDCNCNNCKHMERDLVTQQKWQDWHRKIDFEEFEKKKAKAIQDALGVEEEVSRNASIRIAEKMKFQFNDKAKLIQYGFCGKYQKQVSF